MMGMKPWHRSPKAADITAMLKTLVAMALLKLNGGFSAGIIPMGMKVKKKRKRNLEMKMNRAPRMKSTMATIRKIVPMKADSLLRQDSSLLKQDSSLLRQDSSLLKQDNSLLKQDRVVALMTMTQISEDFDSEFSISQVASFEKSKG